MTLEELERNVEELYINMENELLLNIANKISVSKPMEIDQWSEEIGQPIYGSGGVNEWQLEMLRGLDGLNAENAKIIAKYSGKTVEEIEKVFARAEEIGLEIDGKTIAEGIKAGVLRSVDSDLMQEQIKNILYTAYSTTLTTFNNANNSLLANAGNAYLSIVNRVSSQVLAGTKTTAKAMQEAVSELAQKGLTCFTARNGAQWSTEAYIKMVLRANTQNTVNALQEAQMQASGGDYWEISQHTGARPLCSQDQGQIFSISGNTEAIEDLNGRRIQVRAWSSSTYGEPAGILGINCGHSRFAFVPGVSVYRSEAIDQEENDAFYKETQKQRQYERSIRNQKREISMLKTTGADEDYIRLKQNNLSDIRSEYLNFLDQTGLTRVTTNEWIGSTAL